MSDGGNGNDALNAEPVPEVRRHVHARGDFQLADVAAREYVFAEGDRLAALRHFHIEFVVVVAAARERFVAHARHARGDDGGEHVFAALEGASAQRRHIAVLFVADRPDARLAEGVVADGHAADVAFLTLERERLKFAARKGEVADRLHGGGNFEGLFFGERDDPEECAFRDRRGRCGDRIAAGGFFSGEVHERVAAEEHAVLRTVGGRGALRDLDVSERGARECVGRGFGQIAQLVELRDRGVVSGKGDVCKPCRQGDRGERAVRESAVADRECGRACAGFFEYDRNEVFAACERLRPDLRHACGNDDAVDLAPCKRVRGDRRHAVGDAVAPRLARGHVCRLGCMRLVLCAAVVQHAVLRGIPRIVGARVVNVHRRQRRAALERAHGDIRDGIGDVDLFEGGEARKRVPRDLRDLSAVILCGDGDGGDEPEPRARADGVSVAHPGVCEHVVYPEGVQRNVFGERPGRQRFAVFVRVLRARAVGSAEPAAERLRAVRRSGNGQGVLFAEVNGRVRHAVGAAERDLNALRLVVRIEDELARSCKECVRILCAVALRPVRRIVPCVEQVAVFCGGGGKFHSVADGFIKDALFKGRTAAAVERYGVRRDLRAHPLGCAASAEEANLHGVAPRAGEGFNRIFGGAALDRDDRRVVAVEADLIAERACNGLPREHAVCIVHDGAELVVTEHEGIAERGVRTLRGFELKGIFAAGSPGEEGGEVDGRRTRLHGGLLPVDDDGVRHAFRCVPGERRAVQEQFAGKGGGVLLVAERRCGGGVESARHGYDGDLILCGRSVFEREARSRYGHGRAVDRNVVEGGARHGVPGENVVLHGDARHGVEMALVYEGRLRGRVAVRGRADGKADAALLHVAVGEVEVERRAVVVQRMYVVVVAAVHRDEVFLRALCAAEHERVGCEHADIRNAGKGIVDEVAHRRRPGDGAAARRRGGNFDAVYARLGKFFGNGRARRGLCVSDDRVVRSDDRHEVAVHGSDRVPFDRMLRYADRRRGAFRVVCLPYGEQRGVGVEYRLLRVAE